MAVSLFDDGADIFPAAFQKPALNFTADFLSSEEESDEDHPVFVFALPSEEGLLEIT